MDGDILLKRFAPAGTPWELLEVRVGTGNTTCPKVYGW